MVDGNGGYLQRHSDAQVRIDLRGKEYEKGICSYFKSARPLYSLEFLGGSPLSGIFLDCDGESITDSPLSVGDMIGVDLLSLVSGS